MTQLTEAQQSRYKRNILLGALGEEGQKKLLASRVLVVGLGGLGSPVTYYLAAAGVGTLGLADGDTVELSNLQRQILHSQADLGNPKNLSAEEAITALNPDVTVLRYGRLEDEAAMEEAFAAFDFIIDATDNFAARFRINDVCVRLRKPYSHGGISQFVGQTMTVVPKQTACYGCVFGDPTRARGLDPSEDGVLGAVAGIIGSIQAAEAIKHLTSIGEPLYDTLLYVDSVTMDFRRIPLARQSTCQVCS